MADPKRRGRADRVQEHELNAAAPAEYLGVLEADQKTIRLDARISLAAGRVVVIVSPAVEEKTSLPPELLGPDGQPDKRYRAYLKYQKAYTTARDAYTAAHTAAFTDPRTAARWPIEGVALQAAVDRALGEWMTLGHKAEVEATLRPRDERATKFPPPISSEYDHA